MLRVVLSAVLVGLFGAATSVAEEAESEHERYFEFWQPHAGDWEVTLKEEGQPDVNVLSSFTPSATKLCCVSNGKYSDGTEAGNGLHGYDPVRKCWFDVMVMKREDACMFMTSQLRVDVNKPLRPGMKVDIESVQVVDGKELKFTAVREYMKVSRERLVAVHRNRVTDQSKSLPDVRIVWTRRHPAK